MNIRIETAQAIWNWYHVKFPQGEKPRCHSSWNLFTTSNAMWSYFGPTCTLAQLWSIDVPSVGMLALECSQGTTKNLLFTTQTAFINILASLDSWSQGVRQNWPILSYSIGQSRLLFDCYCDSDSISYKTTIDHVKHIATPSVQATHSVSIVTLPRFLLFDSKVSKKKSPQLLASNFLRQEVQLS